MNSPADILGEVAAGLAEVKATIAASQSDMDAVRSSQRALEKAFSPEDRGGDYSPFADLSVPSDAVATPPAPPTSAVPTGVPQETLQEGTGFPVGADGLVPTPPSPSTTPVPVGPPVEDWTAKYHPSESAVPSDAVATPPAPPTSAIPTGVPQEPLQEGIGFPVGTDDLVPTPPSPSTTPVPVGPPVEDWTAKYHPSESAVPAVFPTAKRWLPDENPATRLPDNEKTDWQYPGPPPVPIGAPADDDEEVPTAEFDSSIPTPPVVSGGASNGSIGRQIANAMGEQSESGRGSGDDSRRTTEEGNIDSDDMSDLKESVFAKLDRALDKYLESDDVREEKDPVLSFSRRVQPGRF